MFCTSCVYLCIIKDVCDVRCLYAKGPWCYAIVDASNAADAFFKQLLFITAQANYSSLFSLGQGNLNHILGCSHWCRLLMATVSILVEWMDPPGRTSLIMEWKGFGVGKRVQRTNRVRTDIVGG